MRLTSRTPTRDLAAHPLARDAAIGLVTGLAGTTTMTATTWLQERVRRTEDLPVDYDATGHVVTAAAQVIRHEPDTEAGRTALFLLVHWGYGSAMAAGHRALLRRLPRTPAAAVFFVGCQTMAFVLFPALGETPRPWRWRRDVLVSSVAQHAVYVATVAATDRVLSRRLSRCDRAQSSA